MSYWAKAGKAKQGLGWDPWLGVSLSSLSRNILGISQLLASRLRGVGPNGIKNFQSRDFQDGILQNPGMPEFLGQEMKFLSRYITKKLRDLPGFPSQQINVVIVIHL